MQNVRVGWSAASRAQKAAIVVAGVIGIGVLGSLVTPAEPVPAATPLGVVSLPTPGDATPAATEEPASAPPTAGTTASATTQPTAAPVATEAPAPKPLPMRLVRLTKTVRAPGTASITVKTAKGARCGIEVVYSSGLSEAAGLKAKRASSTGRVAWSWIVGPNTTPGRWPISVSCSAGNRSGELATSFRVR